MPRPLRQLWTARQRFVPLLCCPVLLLLTWEYGSRRPPNPPRMKCMQPGLRRWLATTRKRASACLTTTRASLVRASAVLTARAVPPDLVSVFHRVTSERHFDHFPVRDGPESLLSLSRAWGLVLLRYRLLGQHRPDRAPHRVPQRLRALCRNAVPARCRFAPAQPVRACILQSLRCEPLRLSCGPACCSIVLSFSCACVSCFLSLPLCVTASIVFHCSLLQLVSRKNKYRAQRGMIDAG
jgi:hypothetical protein